MTPTECVEIIAVEQARYQVLRWVTMTRTYDAGDWARCVAAWDDGLEHHGISDRVDP